MVNNGNEVKRSDSQEWAVCLGGAILGVGRLDVPEKREACLINIAIVFESCSGYTVKEDEEMS